jgi:heptosyltransferase-3
LRSRYEGVDALTLPGHADTLRHVPDLDDVFIDDGADIEAVAAPLRERKYGAAVVTWATQRTAKIARAAQIPIRVGQSRRLYSPLFTHQVTVRSELGDVTTHWSQILLDYPRAIGCDTVDARPRFVVTEADRAEAAGALQARGVQVGSGYSIVHPTCSVSPKRPHWPVDGWIELVRALQARDSRPVLVSGAPVDAPIVEPLVAATGAVSIAGATSIGGFAAIAERADYFVVMHSGPMHVAAAVGTPTVGVFPLQVDYPDRWAPLGGRVAVVRSTYACRPGERMETCPDYACVKNLAVPRILATLDGLLERSGERA